MATKKTIASTKKKVVARASRTKKVAGAATTGAASAVATVQQTQGKLRIASTSSPGTPGAKDEHEVVVVQWDGPRPLSLQGWQVRDKGADHAYTFGDVTLQPNSTIRVHSGGRAAQDTDADVHWVRAKDVWNEKSDVVHLLDSRGVVHAQHIFEAATRRETAGRRKKPAKKASTSRAKKAPAKKKPKRAPIGKKRASRYDEAKRAGRRSSARKAKPARPTTKKVEPAKAAPKSQPAPLLQKPAPSTEKPRKKKAAPKTVRPKAAASPAAKTRRQDPERTPKATRVKKSTVPQSPPSEKPEPKSDAPAKKLRSQAESLSATRKAAPKKPRDKKKAPPAAGPKETVKVSKSPLAPTAKTGKAPEARPTKPKSRPDTRSLRDKPAKPSATPAREPEKTSELLHAEDKLAAQTLSTTTRASRTREPTRAVAQMSAPSQTSPSPGAEQPRTQRSSGWPSDWKLPKPFTLGGVASFLGGLALAWGTATVMPSQTDVSLSEDSLAQLASLEEHTNEVANLADRLTNEATREELVARVIERQELTRAISAVEKSLERVTEAETLKSLTTLRESLVKQAAAQGIAPLPDVGQRLPTGPQPPLASEAIALAIAAVEKAKEDHCGGGGLGQQYEEIDRAINAVDRAIGIFGADKAD